METAERSIKTTSFIANEAKIGNENEFWLQSVKVIRQYTIDCFANISSEERAHCYSETRYRSNVSDAYTYWKKQIW